MTHPDSRYTGMDPPEDRDYVAEVREDFAEFDRKVGLTDEDIERATWEHLQGVKGAQNDHPLHPDEDGCLFTVAYLLVLAVSITGIVIL